MATVKDVTKEKQAKTVQDVNNQDARTRLWQSLNTTYTNQMDESDKAYDKAISQQNNAMLARGMGRSSYAGQIAANMYDDKNRARNKIGEALIADYQNRISDIENQEKEDERWERQFAETLKQNEWQRGFQEAEAARQQGNWEKDYAANRADTAWSQNFQTSQFTYQQQRDKIADQQWQKEYNEQLRQFNENMAYQKERAKVSDAQWEKTYNENLRQFNAQMAQQEAQFKANLQFQQSEAARQQGNWEQEYAANRADTAWTQAFQQSEAARNQSNWQAEYNANRADTAWSQAFQQSEAARNQSNFELQQAFAERQWEAQQEQWREQFDYSKMSDSQKLAYNYIVAAASNGGDVSDALLNQAGISRQDYNAMKTQAVASGGVAGNKNNTNKDDTNTPAANPSATFLNGLNSFQTWTTTGNKTSQTTSTSKNDAVTVTTNGVSKNVRSLNQLLNKKPVIDERK